MASLPSSPLQIAELGSLELIARRLVEGMMTGRHRSPYRGSSVEFVEHRDYTPGDEIRHIDWRAWGRTGRYYIREFEDETNLRAHLLVDASGSMIYAGNSISKFDYARMIAASMACLLLRQIPSSRSSPTSSSRSLATRIARRSCPTGSKPWRAASAHPFRRW